MKKFKAIIVEDIENEAKYLSNTIQNLLPQIEVVSVCNTIAKAKTAIETLLPQLLFLDIDVGSENGFDLLKQLSVKSFKIIFTTGHSDKALDALRVSAVDYLQKPYSDDDLITAVNRAAEILENENANELSGNIDFILKNLSAKNKEKVLRLINKDGEHRIPITDIIFCSTVTQISADGNAGVRIVFRILNGESVVVSNKSISEYEEILKPCDFFKVSAAFLINMNHIKVYQRKGSMLIMKGYKNEQGKIVEEDIYISDSKKDLFAKVYNEFGATLN